MFSVSRASTWNADLFADAFFLIQALQSGDESLLEQCLSVGDQGMIEATVERLPSSKVLQFLLRYVYIYTHTPFVRHACRVLPVLELMTPEGYVDVRGGVGGTVLV